MFLLHLEKKANKGNDDDDKVVVTKLHSDIPSRLMIAYIAQVIYQNQNNGGKE